MDAIDAWHDGLVAVVEARRQLVEALAQLDTAMASAKAAGATWDELSYVTGQTRTTVRRWVAEAASPRPRRLALLRSSLELPGPRMPGEVPGAVAS